MNTNSLADLLNQKLRIYITDGRLIEGNLQCVDKDLNFILGNATEYYVDEEFAEPKPTNVFRVLGMALVPGNHVKKVLKYQGVDAPELNNV